MRKLDSGVKERRNGGTEARDDKNKEEDFEALEIHKLARSIRKKFYALARQLPEEEKYLLKPQIITASRSLTNNIAEARGRYYFQAQVRFIRDSIGSLNELIDDANICIDESYFDEQYIVDLKKECYDLRKKSKRYISYLRRSKLGWEEIRDTHVEDEK